MTKSEFAKRSDRLVSKRAFWLWVSLNAPLFVAATAVFGGTVPQTETGIAWKAHSSGAPLFGIRQQAEINDSSSADCSLRNSRETRDALTFRSHATPDAGSLTLGETGNNLNMTLRMNNGTADLTNTSSSVVHAWDGNVTIAAGSTVKIAGTAGDQIFDIRGLSLQNGSFSVSGEMEAIASILIGNLALNPFVLPFIREVPEIHAEGSRDAPQAEALECAMRSGRPTGRLLRRPDGFLQIRPTAAPLKVVISHQTQTIVYRRATPDELLLEAAQIWSKIHSSCLE